MNPGRLLFAPALAILVAGPAFGVPTFTKEAGPLVSSATISAATGAYPALRAYYIRDSTAVYSATTPEGLVFTEEGGVRLDSTTAPALDIAISSITGLSILPLTAGGFRMLYSVEGTTGSFRVYSATSADGLAWANQAGPAVDIPGTFSGFPSLALLQSGDWRLYFIRDFNGGNDAADKQIFSALSTDEGVSWTTGPVVVSTRASQVAASVRTDGRVRLFYSQPLAGLTTGAAILSVLSTDANGTTFAAETGARVSTAVASGSVSHPFVVRSTDSWRWRLYYDFAPPGASTSSAFSALTFHPDPQSVTPTSVFVDDPARSFRVLGEIFDPAVSAKLAFTGQPDILGTGPVRTDDQTLDVTFDTLNKAVAPWDLVLTDPNTLATTLPKAVRIDFKAGSVQTLDNLLRPRQGARTQIDLIVFQDGPATAKIYTIRGALVATVLDAVIAQGTTTVFWDGKTAQGNTVASGVYLLKVTGPKLDTTTKIVVIK